jgi:prevent-host-death family protein
MPRRTNAAGLPKPFLILYSSQYHYITSSQMEEAISAAEANRKFSLLLRGIREGRSYVVTSHGKPVARLVPAGKHGEMATGARTALLARLARQPVARAGRWTREELYEDDR